MELDDLLEALNAGDAITGDSPLHEVMHPRSPLLWARLHEYAQWLTEPRWFQPVRGPVFPSHS